MKLIAVALTANLLMSTYADAQIIRCKLTDYNMLGHSQHNQNDIIKSYLGERFVLDTRKNVLQRGWKKGWLKPDKITEISKTSQFTAYKWVDEGKDSKGNLLRRSYSYRIYKNGRSEAHMAILNGYYGSLKAMGTCKS